MTDQFPGVTKMVLSPAAQAVLDAAYALPLNKHGQPNIAAVLRAAVHWLAYETQLDDPMMTTTHVVNVDDLDRVAAELEQLDD